MKMKLRKKTKKRKTELTVKCVRVLFLKTNKIKQSKTKLEKNKKTKKKLKKENEFKKKEKNK